MSYIIQNYNDLGFGSPEVNFSLNSFSKIGNKQISNYGFSSQNLDFENNEYINQKDFNFGLNDVFDSIANQFAKKDTDIKKESVLKRRRRKNRGKGKRDRLEWALVSKKKPKKILKWFGPDKPSKKQIAKEEARIHAFAGA